MVWTIVVKHDMVSISGQSLEGTDLMSNTESVPLNSS
jgi:hypothetical protein